MKGDVRSLAAEIVSVRDLAKAQKLVAALEKAGCGWKPVGGRENNFGTINIGSDPGHALIERVTNAIDAAIEREAIRQLSKKRGGMPGSPREAAEAWFKVPAGRLSNLDIRQRQALADNVVVSLHEGSARRRPVVEIRDFGIGLTPHSMPKTILSLGESNKISKPYLAGAYGQGGSTALASSPHGTLIVSRRQIDMLDGARDEVGVTFVRYIELDPTENRNGRYDYLVGPNEEIIGLPAKALPFEAGTSVVHFDMEIHRYAARMTQLTGSLWWLLQNALFDPVLPFWAEERRPSELGEKKVDRRTIVGNYTRLNDDKKDKVEHADSVDVWVNHHAGRTGVKVNYWVMRERDGSTQAGVDSYVDPYHPISYTLYGQLHGTDERREIVERLQLPNLAKSLIVQVEIDNVTPAAKRDLLSTTRDRLKQSPFFDALRAQIWDALAEDEDLIRLDQERKEKLLAHHSEKDRERIRERFAKLLERFRVGKDPVSSGKGASNGGRSGSGSGSRDPALPLPTRKEPTFIRIANVQKPVSVRLDRSALLRLESDAPDGYLTNRVHASLTLGSDPEGVIVMDSRSDFRGGRARMTIRPGPKAQAGSKGAVTVFLLTTSKETFSAKITFAVEKQDTEERSAGNSGKSKADVPEPIPVTERGPGLKWKDLDWDEKSVAEVRAGRNGVDTKIYVNVDGLHIAKLLRTAGYQEVGMKRMRNSYLLYTGFYAYVQHATLARKRLGLEGKEFESYVASELDRVSQTVVHAISATGRLEGDED